MTDELGHQFIPPAHDPGLAKAKRHAAAAEEWAREVALERDAVQARIESLEEVLRYTLSVVESGGTLDVDRLESALEETQRWVEDRS